MINTDRNKRFTVYLPIELDDDLGKIAKNNGMSKAGVVRFLIMKEIARITKESSNSFTNLN